ncbi:required for excision 1-B domain-containing protein [Anarrhichthys ocellatus]|uniref:required for excision 1-B domain-containing protein n=1 Tax=Anarrhichthys ocellatus TaxID=433405 RepID=UPI0012EE6CE4|nr:required for excision 1-B domain-containing protein [Anarrhichthys ocellatus]
MVPTDFTTLIQRFYHLQSERVETYQLFDEGHEAYLRTGPHYDFDHYRQLVNEITQAFCGISKEMLEIKGKLHHEFDRPALSEHIEKLQSKEKQKLELTAKLQLARQRAQDHPEDADCQEQIQEIKHEIIKNKEALSEIMQDFKYDSEEFD